MRKFSARWWVTDQLLAWWTMVMRGGFVGPLYAFEGYRNVEEINNEYRWPRLRSTAVTTDAYCCNCGHHEKFHLSNGRCALCDCHEFD